MKSPVRWMKVINITLMRMIHRYVHEQNIAVLWVTHDKDEINHADKVITLQPHAGEMQEARYELA